MKERIVIAFVAIVIGLVLTTVGYLLYQSFQMQSAGTPQTKKTSSQPLTLSTPTPDHNKLYVSLTEPKDESLTDKRTVTIKGSTNPGNTVIISSNQEDTVATPNGDGTFSTTITINAGANLLITRAVDKQGNEANDTRTVTYSTEDF